MGRKRSCPPGAHRCTRLALRDDRLPCAKTIPQGEAPWCWSKPQAPFAITRVSSLSSLPDCISIVGSLASQETPMKNPFLFDLAKSKPLVDKTKSGTVRGAYEKNFPVVKERAGAMFLVILDKGGIREPHWHPNAWEFDYCISGRARMSVVTPDNEWKIFDVEPGQAVFVPQGYFHYFENIGDDKLHFLVVFN